MTAKERATAAKRKIQQPRREVRQDRRRVKGFLEDNDSHRVTSGSLKRDKEEAVAS